MNKKLEMAAEKLFLENKLFTLENECEFYDLDNKLIDVNAEIIEIAGGHIYLTREAAETFSKILLEDSEEKGFISDFETEISEIGIELMNQDFLLGSYINDYVEENKLVRYDERFSKFLKEENLINHFDLKEFSVRLTENRTLEDAENDACDQLLEEFEDKLKLGEDETCEGIEILVKAIRKKM